MKQKNPTLLLKLKVFEAEAEDEEELVSNLTPQDDSNYSNESRDHIVKNSTVIPVLICKTGYSSPTIVHSLENPPRKKDRYNKKILGAIGKREYENDVVWITLQACQFNWKKVNIPNLKGYGTYIMYILYANPDHREKF